MCPPGNLKDLDSPAKCPPGNLWDLDSPCEVPTRESMGFSPPHEMLAVCLLDLGAAFRHPLPWQRDLYVVQGVVYNHLIHTCVDNDTTEPSQ